MDDEARHNLATRVMSNGVEVIVAGDKTTLPGEPNLRILLRPTPSTATTTTTTTTATASPSTLTGDHMMMMLPASDTIDAHGSSEEIDVRMGSEVGYPNHNDLFRIYIYI